MIYPMVVARFVRLVDWPNANPLLSSGKSWLVSCLIVVFLMTSALETGFGQPPGELERAWETDPRLNGTWVSEFPVRAIELNLQDFGSESIATRFHAAQLALELANQQKETKRPEVLDKLLTTLEKGESNQRTKLMMVAAAAAWSDDTTVERLLLIAEQDAESRACIEEAMIRLRSNLPLKLWRSTVSTTTSNQSDVARALVGIGTCGQASDTDLLREYLQNERGNAALQINAARALGLCSRSGQVGLAQQVLNTQKAIRFQLASLILVQHTEETALPLLRKIIAEGGGEAKQIAFVGLSQSDRMGARELAPSLLTDSDSGVRRAVVSFLQSFDDRASFLLLARRLADPIPSIRQQVRKELLKRSFAPEFRSVVDKIISQAVTASQFEAIEQAIVLMVELSDTTRDEALLKLLDHPNPEVNIRAAWALRILATNPKTLDAMLEHALRWADKITSATDPILRVEVDEHRVVFLLEAFGIRKFEKAESLLRRCVKKAPGVERLPLRNRLAGIWAIGMLYENRMDDELRQTLEERMNDLPPAADSEPNEVRYVCAIAIARNGAEGAVATLSKFLGTPGEALHEGCNWALEHLKSKGISR